MTETSLRALSIIDPHLHLVNLSTGIYSRFADRMPGEPFGTDYLLDDLIADAAGGPNIVGVVHVEALPDDPLREAATVSAIAATAPFPIGLVGHADLLSNGFEPILDGLAAHPSFRGIRQVANIHPNPAFALATRDILNADGFEDGLRILGQRDLSFDMQILGHQMVRGAKVSATCPQTPIVVNHAGLWSDRTPEGWATWKAGLRLLAANPNVTIKISGLGMRDAGWTTEAIRPIVYEVLDAFGPDRSMFASNFPVDGQHAGYARIWQAFDDITAAMTSTERDRLFHGTAREVYRL
ncbi:amidohydrolase family protein [Roseisalinus antarcticus]|uniref:Amidohydrolase n=1 Tax=Roseisalinus antarcticus TaxID=254357 RepID=A0A1Y5TWH9_9RHOB|nr:amidohydrolase family protein [Roseisalinus antarcticus]SLN75379.1 Amidohydrolase [Roseisalinus antarcticus]